MYQGRTFIRESVYVCGNYMDADIYPVFQKPGRRRSRCKPTSEIQRRLNQKNAEKRLTRLVHTNFTEDDVALHLTYRPGEEPETKEGAQRDLQNYIRRLKRRYERKTQTGWEKIVEDVKSRATRTQKYIIKRKMMQDRYGIEIKEI